MHRYRGATSRFIADAVRARLANQLADRFFEEFRYRPAPPEVTSWRNSLLAMANVLRLADLKDQGILVEFKLPLTSKGLDVLLTGSNRAVGDSAFVVGLKHWTKVDHSNVSHETSIRRGRVSAQ